MHTDLASSLYGNLMPHTMQAFEDVELLSGRGGSWCGK